VKEGRVFAELRSSIADAFTGDFGNDLAQAAHGRV
jgi:hypothetical protein